ncbi:uncharacterized protein LOC119433154 [Dermacentor silvarum]|uniref:uncharacterized protein LOC119433154 n=1 Tax=Dermacentor silvarum TaxID=543639 RepID=UPI001896DD5B|nr:uncharacterized protein LOC119433154 [Dermacentor silvarum]
MQTRLLKLPDPSLDDVVKAAQAMDTAAKDAGEIGRATGSPSTEATVNKMATKGGTCSRCGGYHSPSQCQFSHAQCFTCGKTGHLAQGSRRKGSRLGRAAAGSGPSAARLHVVAEKPPIFDLWHTGLVPSSVPPYMLTVEVCAHTISMELDTGASVSVMAGKLFKRTFPGVSVEASGFMLLSYSGQLSQVQGEAQSLFQLGVGTFAGTTASIYVPEGAQPRFSKPRPLLFALKNGVTQELQRLQREGILMPVKTSEWAAPIVPVLKRDGSVRICGDFKFSINPVATVEKYPLPRIEDLWSVSSGGRKFNKLDLKDAYQQLREMDNLSRGMRHVMVYLDDILVTGTDDGDHLQNLQNVLARLQDAGLKIKLDKCVFLAASVEYLGHVISQASLSPALCKVDAVLKAPKPHNKELQSYLGVNFYRSFLPNLSAHLQPLHLLFRDRQQWTWKEEQDVSFQHSKKLITKAPVLVHFDPGKTVVLTVDASPYSYLWGKKFEEVTDHKLLLGLLGSDNAVPVQASPRVVRWALRLAASSYRMVYHPGKHLGPADGLSRLPRPEATSRDPVLSQMVKAVSRGEELVQQAYSHKAAELSLQQGCLLWGSRVVIPQSLWSRVLQLLHAGHPGVEKTKMVARSHPSTRPEDISTHYKNRWVPGSVPPAYDAVLPFATPSVGVTVAALRQVFAAQGLPDIFVSDNGHAFARTEYLAWLTKNEIRRMMVPPYHPASNGAAERVV